MDILFGGVEPFVQFGRGHYGKRSCEIILNLVKGQCHINLKYVKNLLWLIMPTPYSFIFSLHGIGVECGSSQPWVKSACQFGPRQLGLVLYSLRFSQSVLWVRDYKNGSAILFCVLLKMFNKGLRE